MGRRKGGVSSYCCVVVSLNEVTSAATLRDFRVHYDCRINIMISPHTANHI